MDYDESSYAFYRANLAGSPAELHGFLSGSISGANFYSAESLVLTVAKFLEVETERVEDLGDMLANLYHFSIHQMNGNDFEFRPILPNDDVILSERLASVGDWCQGFLYGLGNSKYLSNVETPENIEEALGDLASISNIQILSDQEEVNESDSESNYIEVTEYIKVAVLTISSELNCIDDSDSGLTY